MCVCVCVCVCVWFKALTGLSTFVSRSRATRGRCNVLVWPRWEPAHVNHLPIVGFVSSRKHTLHHSEISPEFLLWVVIGNFVCPRRQVKEERFLRDEVISVRHGGQ
jgi:hypothetical protein